MIEENDSESRDEASHEEIIYLAGGCFWGMQDLLRRYPGIESTRVGYMGGTLPNATYLQLKHQPSGHAETVEVCYDPDKISEWTVLSLFFQIHDPTTSNRQGNDRGESYRSVIFYTNERQRDTARKAITVLNASGLWPGIAVTEVLPAGDFWLAEPEHQNYLERYPNGYTCHWVRPEWRLPIPSGEDK